MTSPPPGLSLKPPPRSHRGGFLRTVGMRLALQTFVICGGVFVALLAIYFGSLAILALAETHGHPLCSRSTLIRYAEPSNRMAELPVFGDAVRVWGQGLSWVSEHIPKHKPEAKPTP